MFQKRSHIALVAASALLLLTGCSAGASQTGSANGAQSDAPAAEQSKSEACDIVKARFEDFKQMASNSSSSDPQAAVTAFKDLAAKTNDSLTSITNSEVKPAATKAAAALSDYVAFLEKVLADPNEASAMSDQAKALQDGFTEAATVCGD